MEEENKPVPEAAAVTTLENPPSTEAQPEDPGDSKEYTPIGDVKYYEPGISGDEGLEGDGDVADEGANGDSPSALTGEFAIDPKKAKKAARKEKKKAKARGKDLEPEPEPLAEPKPEPEKAEVDVNPIAVRESGKKGSKAKKKTKKANKGKGSDPDLPTEPTPDAEADAEKPEEPTEPPAPKETGKREKDKKNKKKKGKNGKDESGPAKSRSAASEDAPPPPPPPPGDEPAPPNDSEGAAEQDASPPPPPPPPNDEPAPPKEEGSADHDTPIPPPPPPPSDEPEPPKEEGAAHQDAPAPPPPPPPVEEPARSEVEAVTKGTTEESAKPTEEVLAEPPVEKISKGDDAEPRPDESENSASKEPPEAATESSADVPVKEAKDEPTLATHDGDNATTTQGEGSPDTPSGDGTEETAGNKSADVPAPPDAEPAVSEEPSTAETIPDDKPAETSADSAATPATENPVPEPEAAASTEKSIAEEAVTPEAEKPSEEALTSEEVTAMDAGEIKGDDSDEKPKGEATPAEGQDTELAGSDEAATTEVETPAAIETQERDPALSEEKPAEAELVDDPADDSGYAEIADSPAEEKPGDASMSGEADTEEASAETATENDGAVDSSEKAPADQNAKAHDSEPADLPEIDAAVNGAEPESVAESSTADKDATSQKAEAETAAEASAPVNAVKPKEVELAETEPEAKEPYNEQKPDVEQKPDEPAAEPENATSAGSDEPKTDEAPEWEAVPKADDTPDSAPADAAVSEEPRDEPEATETDENDADVSETPELESESKTEEAAPADSEPPVEPASDDPKDEPASDPPASDPKDEPGAPQNADTEPSAEHSAEPTANPVEDTDLRDVGGKVETEIADGAPSAAADEKPAPEPEVRDSTRPTTTEGDEAETAQKEDSDPAEASIGPESKIDSDDNKDGLTGEPGEDIPKPEGSAAPAESEINEEPADSVSPKDDASAECCTSDEPTAAELIDSVDDKPVEDMAPAAENIILGTEKPADEQPSEDPAVAGEAQDKPNETSKPAEDAPPAESDEVAKGDDESAQAPPSDDKQNENVKPSEDSTTEAAEVSKDDGKLNYGPAPEAAVDVVAEKATQTDDDLPLAEDKPTEPAVEPTDKPTSAGKTEESALNAKDGPVAEKATQTEALATGEENKRAETAAEKPENEVSPAEAQTDGAVDGEPESKPEFSDGVKEEPVGKVEEGVPVDTPSEPAETVDENPTGDDAPAESNAVVIGDKPAEEADLENPAEANPDSDPAPVAENPAEANPDSDPDPVAENPAEEPVATEGRDPLKDEPTADIAESVEPSKEAAEVEQGSEGDQAPAKAKVTEEPPATEEEEPEEPSPEPATELKEEPTGSNEPEPAAEPAEEANDEPAEPTETEAAETPAEGVKDDPAQPEAAVEPVEGAKDELAGEPTVAAESETTAEVEKPEAVEVTQSEPEKPVEESQAADTPVSAERDTPTESNAAVDSAETKEDPSAEKTTENDKAPEDPLAAEAETAKDESVAEEKVTENNNTAEEAPVEASAEPPAELPAKTTDGAKDQPLPEEKAAEAEVPAEVTEEPAMDKANEEPLAPPVDEPTPEAEKPVEPAPSEDKKEDLTEPAKEDKPAETPEPSAKDAKADDDDEGKDTLGPIPSEEKQAAAKTGENLHTTPHTRDFVQDLGESVSRPDEVAVYDVERSEGSTGLTGEHSHVDRETVESVTGAVGVVPEDGSRPVVSLDPNLEEAAGAGVDFFDTPVAEAQDASGGRQDGNGDKIPPADEVAHSTTQIEQIVDKDGQDSGEAASRADKDDKAAATEPEIKGDHEPTALQVQEAEVLEPDEKGPAGTPGTEQYSSQQKEESSSTGTKTTAVMESITGDEKGGLEAAEPHVAAQDTITTDSGADEKPGQASHPESATQEPEAPTAPSDLDESGKQKGEDEFAEQATRSSGNEQALGTLDTAKQDSGLLDVNKTTEVVESSSPICQVMGDDEQTAGSSGQETEGQTGEPRVEEGTDATVQLETGAHHESTIQEAGENAAAESSGDYSTTKRQPTDGEIEDENPISATSADGQPSEEAPEDASKSTGTEDLPPSTTAVSIVVDPTAVETSEDPSQEEETPEEKHIEDLVDSIPVSAGATIQNSDAVSATDYQHQPADETKDGSVGPAKQSRDEAPEVSAESVATTEEQANLEQRDSSEAKPAGDNLPAGEREAPSTVPNEDLAKTSVEPSSAVAEALVRSPVTDANAEAVRAVDEQSKPPAVDSGAKALVTQYQSTERVVEEYPTPGVLYTAEGPAAEVISETKPTSTETERVTDDEVATPPTVDVDAQHPVYEQKVQEIPLKEDATTSEEPGVPPVNDVTDVVEPKPVEHISTTETHTLATSSQAEKAATPEAPFQEDSGDDVETAKVEAPIQVVHVDEEIPAETAADTPVREPVEDEVAQPDVSAPNETLTSSGAESEAVTAGQELLEEKAVQVEVSDPKKTGPDGVNPDEPFLPVGNSDLEPIEELVEPAVAEVSDNAASGDLPVEPIEPASAKNSETLALDDTPDSTIAATALPEEHPAENTTRESQDVAEETPASKKPVDIPSVAEADNPQTDIPSVAPPDATYYSENKTTDAPSTLRLDVSGAASPASVSVGEPPDRQVAAKETPNLDDEVDAEVTVRDESITGTTEAPETESSLGPAVFEGQKTLSTEDQKAVDVNIQQMEAAPTKSVKATQLSRTALTGPIVTSAVEPDDDKQDDVVTISAEEVVAEPPASEVPEKEQVASTETIQDESLASEVEQLHTAPSATSIIDESAERDDVPVFLVENASTTSDIRATDNTSGTMGISNKGEGSVRVSAEVIETSEIEPSAGADSSTPDVSHNITVAREQDEAATSREPLQTDVGPDASVPEVAIGISEVQSPVVQEATPAEPGEPVIEAADRSSPDDLPVMDDEDDFVLVSPSEVPDKDSVEDSQVIKPVEEGETLVAALDPAARPEDHPVATGELAPVQNETQLEPAVPPNSLGESAREAAEATAINPDGVDSIAPSEKASQMEPPSGPTTAVEPATITAGEPAKSVEPSAGNVAANDVVIEKLVGCEASESVEPPVEEAGDSQKLVIVKETEVVGSEPSQEKAVSVPEDETLPGTENKSAAETTEEFPENQEPEAVATTENTPKEEPVIEDREVVTETSSIPAEVSALSEETVLFSQPISAPNEGTDISKDDEPVLVEPPLQREDEPVSVSQKPLKEHVHVDDERSRQPVQSAMPDQAPDSSELQTRDASNFKTQLQVDSSIGEAVPVVTASEDISATTEAVPRVVSDAAMTTGRPTDSVTPVEGPRNEPLGSQGPNSRGIGETLRADSPVIPEIIPKPTSSQQDAKVDDQAGPLGLDNVDASVSDVGSRSVPQETLDSPPDEGLPGTKVALAVGAMIGGAVGGSTSLAVAQHAPDSGRGKDKKPIGGTVLQDLPQIPTRQGSLSASYNVVYSEGPSGGENVSPTRRMEKGKPPDSGIESNNCVSLRTRKSHLATLNLSEQRADTPPIVLPTTADLPPARPPQRPRQLRRARKMSIARAEEEIAAAVVIYASADALSPPGSPAREPRPFHFPADGGPSKEFTSATHLQDSRMDSPTVVNSHVGDEDLRQSIADLFTDNDKSSDDKDRDRDRERRRRRRSSHHHHRSSRDGESGESRRHSHSSSHSYRHHRSRAESERSSRTPPDTTPPRTPTRAPRRQDSGYEGEGSERSHRRHHRRSPEEQADHERRRERRLREKERETERDRRESDRDRRDGDRDRREDRREPRDGDRERHRRSRPGTSRSHKDIPTDDSPPKKFLDMDHSRGVLAGPKDVPKDVPPPPPSSSRGDLPRRSNTTRSKLGRSRRSEDVGGRPHRSRTGDERVRRRSEERLRSEDKMRSEDRLRSEDKLRSDERLRSDDRLPRKGEGEGTRAEEARRRARQEERMRAKEKDDEKRSGFRAAFKKIFS